MFRNKILVRAEPPLPSSSFLLRTLSLLSPHPEIDAETLCWKLARRCRVACLPFPSRILLLYQRSQSDSAARAVEQLTRSLPIGDVGEEEEEAGPSSLVARAVECALRCTMLESGWRCVGDHSFVRSSFAPAEERTHLDAVNVRVQLEKDDELVFVVSPDVVRFSRHKISDLVSSKTLQKFDNGEEVNLEDYEFSTSCTILPSLHEGHVIGLSKLLPDGEDFKRLEELWFLKHGLALPSDFFMHIQPIFGSQSNKQWFPSPLVLQGSGLAPAPQTIRASKAIQALESCLNIIGAWNFFDQGLLKIKEVSSLAIGTTIPVWKKVPSRTTDCIANGNGSLNIHDTMSEKNVISEDLLFTLDFRTPKLASKCGVKNGTLENAKTQEIAVSSNEVILEHTPICISNEASSNSIIKVRPLPLECAPIKRITHMGKWNGKLRCSLGTNNELRSEVLGIGTLESTRPDNLADRTQPHSSTSNNLSETNKDNNAPISGCARLSFVENRSTIIETHAFAEADTSGEGISEQSNGENLLSISKALMDKENSEKYIEDNCLPNPSKVPQAENLRNGISEDTKENKDNELEGFKKKRTKPDSDRSDTAPMRRTKQKTGQPEKVTEKKGKQDIEQSDISMKVMDYHARGELRALTVADLKCFLATKKAKVGGKKEDLIQRITDLLA